MKNPGTADFNRLSAIVQSSDDAIISRDMNGTITSWNPSAEKIFGYSAAEARGKHISIIIPDECSAEEETLIQRIKSGKPVKKYVTIRKRKDGTKFFSSHIVTAVKDANKKVVGASKIISDISSQKSFFAAIINTSDDAICSKSLDGIITTWNFGAERMFGYTEHEVLGKHVDIIVHPSKMDEESEIRNKIRSGQRLLPFDTIRVRKDGSAVNVSLTISPNIPYGCCVVAIGLSSPSWYKKTFMSSPILVSGGIKRFGNRIPFSPSSKKTPIDFSLITFNILYSPIFIITEHIKNLCRIN